MLKVDNVSFSYDNSNVLKDINLSIKSGEMVGLSGVSGRGKTTLAKIMAGYIKPDTGSVLVDGYEISSFKAMKPVQLIFQHPECALDPKFRIGKSLSEGWNVDQYTKDLFGIKDEWLDRYPSQLSGGQIQRICLARAVCPGVKYLIADEITTMLDPINQVLICDALGDLAANNNIGILFISHDQALLDRVCNRQINL